MPEEETASVDLSKLTDLLGSVSQVDEKGKQVNPIAVLILVILIGFVIAGVGIAMGITKRKAVKAQYEADKAKEDAKRAEADAKMATLQAAVELKLEEAASLSEQAAAHEAAAAEARDQYEAYAMELRSATTWDDIHVRRTGDES